MSQHAFATYVHNEREGLAKALLDQCSDSPEVTGSKKFRTSTSNLPKGTLISSAQAFLPAA